MKLAIASGKGGTGKTADPLRGCGALYRLRALRRRLLVVTTSAVSGTAETVTTNPNFRLLRTKISVFDSDGDTYAQATFAHRIGCVADGMCARRGFPCTAAHYHAGGAVYSDCNTRTGGNRDAHAIANGDVHAGAHGAAHSPHRDAGSDSHSHP